MLQILKKDYQVNEAVLRVGISRQNFSVVWACTNRDSIGEQSRSGCRQTTNTCVKDCLRPCEGYREEVEERRGEGEAGPSQWGVEQAGAEWKTSPKCVLISSSTMKGPDGRCLQPGRPQWLRIASRRRRQRTRRPRGRTKPTA